MLGCSSSDLKIEGENTMWKCSKCGHKSGKRMKSSKGCDHEWWDEKELAIAKCRKEEELAYARWLETDEGKKEQEWQAIIKQRNEEERGFWNKWWYGILIFLFVLFLIMCLYAY